MGKLSASETAKILKKYKIPVPRQATAEKNKELTEKAKRIGYPVVLKIESPDIVHKTEAKCVVTDIRNDKELLESSRKIVKNAKRHGKKARIKGFLVQEHFRGYETIVGGKRDEQFGPVVLFGAGGIFTELLKDNSIRICPIKRREAKEMVGEIRFSRVLDGFRGEPPADRKKITDVIMAVNRIMTREKVKELDINPLMVSEKGVRAVDVRIIK